MSQLSSVPPEYEGREQTYLKHMVLRKYLSSWVQKLARTRQTEGRVRLWYVDCFAGPWQEKGQKLEDTSIAIGLDALDGVLESPDLNIDASAIFIEKELEPYRRLEAFLRGRESRIDAGAIHGEFGENVEKINSLVADDPAFIFIDPTGWKGVDMGFVAPLLHRPRRDILVNVMFNHVNRFKDDNRKFLRDQMREFFGLENPSELRGKSESELMELYRTKLKDHSKSKYSLYIAVAHPTIERTWFYLVVAGSNSALVKLFRQVEASVVGGIAGEVRRDAKRRASDAPGQGAFKFDNDPPDHRYAVLNKAALDSVPREVEMILRRRNKIQFRDLWPKLLERHHITLVDLQGMIMSMRQAGRLRIEGMRDRERTPKDDHWLHAGE